MDQVVEESARRLVALVNNAVLLNDIAIGLGVLLKRLRYCLVMGEVLRLTHWERIGIKVETCRSNIHSKGLIVR